MSDDFDWDLEDDGDPEGTWDLIDGATVVALKEGVVLGLSDGGGLEEGEGLDDGFLVGAEVGFNEGENDG